MLKNISMRPKRKRKAPQSDLSRTDTSKTFSRRAFVVGGIQGTFLCVLGGRLAWLQMSQGERYTTLANRNRINMKMTSPSRGQVFDRYGVPLAINQRNFRVLVIPEQTENIEAALRTLSKHVTLTEENIQDVLKTAKKTARFIPVEIIDNLEWDDVAKIEVNIPSLPGLSIDVGEQRSYPFGKSTAHLVGYVGSVTEKDLKKGPRMMRLPGMKVGKTGIEKAYDTEMRGKAGASEVEVNVSGREVRELKNTPSNSGQRIVLSIDGELQRRTLERLEQERSASAVIMDIHNGAVYALASSPSFDPNIFTQGLSAAMWEELLADPGLPLTNKAISGQYPPASTFKMVTALAALKAGKITENTSVFCPGHYTYGGDRFHCWKSAGHGSVNLINALAVSCDTYFYKIATEVGIDALASMARTLGLGSKLGFELSEERSGLMPDKDWKMGYFGESWKPGETIVASIGQGYIQSTPLQMATMAARLLNGGHAVKPWVTQNSENSDRSHTQVWPKMDVHPWHLQLVKRGMDKVVNHKVGTAYGARIEDPAFKMGGKTGTAQVRRITMKQRAQGVRNEDLPWEQRHHALFVGYAPLKKPQYACCVVVEHGVGGSSTAAPLARDLMLETQKRAPAKTKIHNADL
jgi:penicillin-binding protein 2